MIYPTYEMYLIHEEFLTADEYLRRVAAGQIDPREVEIVPPSQACIWGGFKVKLKVPRYKPIFDEEREHVCA